MKIITLLKNKYLIVTVIFLVWVFFFAQYDLISQKSQIQEMKEMNTKIEYLQKEVEELHKENVLIKTDSTILEKYAREKYFMKKNNEDVFVFDTLNNSNSTTLH